MIFDTDTGLLLQSDYDYNVNYQFKLATKDCPIVFPETSGLIDFTITRSDDKGFSFNHFDILGVGGNKAGTATSTQAQGIRFPAASCDK